MATKSEKTLPRFRGFYLAAILGVVVTGATLVLDAAMAVEIGANVFFIAYLAMAFRQLPHLSVRHLEAHADETDAPVGAIFAVTVAVVALCVGSMIALVNAGGAPDMVRLILSVLSVVLSWFTVHTMAGLHYAYEYYESDGAADGGRNAVGGLQFPGKDMPDGVSFLYFAYVLGMTAQTSDVAITSRAMRRLVIVHSVFAFFFNTVIVAAMVNLAVSLGQ